MKPRTTVSYTPSLVHWWERIPMGDTDMLRRVKQCYMQAADLVGTPYVFAGGHNVEWLPSLAYERGIGAPGAGYDCSSGSSVVLRAGGLCWNPRPPFPLATGNFMSWGEPGEGRYLTMYVRNDPGHEHMGLKFTIAATGFYSHTFWQAANPRNGIAWLGLDTATMFARHWPGT